MDDEKRKSNYLKLAKYVNKYTSAWWGESFVGELNRISVQTAQKKKGLTSPQSSQAMGNAKSKVEEITEGMSGLAGKVKEAVIGGDEHQKA